jgi:hypothetical protein
VQPLINRIRLAIEREHGFKMLPETATALHELFKGGWRIGIGDQITLRLAVGQFGIQRPHQVLIDDGKRRAEPDVNSGDNEERLIHHCLCIGDEVYQPYTDKLVG